MASQDDLLRAHLTNPGDRRSNFLNRLLVGPVTGFLRHSGHQDDSALLPQLLRQRRKRALPTALSVDEYDTAQTLGVTERRPEASERQSGQDQQWKSQTDQALFHLWWPRCQRRSCSAQATTVTYLTHHFGRVDLPQDKVSKVRMARTPLSYSGGGATGRLALPISVVKRTKTSRKKRSLETGCARLGLSFQVACVQEHVTPASSLSHRDRKGAARQSPRQER